MATWVGSVLFLTGDLRRSLAEPASQLGLLRDRMARQARLGAISAFGTVLSGFGLIFAGSGFGGVPAEIHAGMTTGIAALVVGGALIGRTITAIDAALAQGQRELGPLVGRLTMSVGIFHALWLISLIAMVFRGRIF